MQLSFVSTFGLSQCKMSFCSRALYIRSFASSRFATVLSLERSNTAVVRSFLESFRLCFLWLRLTTEVATGEYRGYGRAGTDSERMMDGSVRKLQGRPKDQRLTRCPREKLLKIGEGFVRLGGIRLRHAQSGHAITAPRN
jgi:hypothetical protein